MRQWIRSLSRWIPVLLIAAIAVGCQSKQEQLDEYRKRAEAYYADQKWAEAKIEYLNLLQLDKDDAEASFKLGETLLNLAEGSEALFRFQEAVRLDPENVQYRLRLGFFEMYGSRRMDKAREHAEFVLQKDPKSIDGLMLRAQIRGQSKDREGQLADLARAEQLDPKRAGVALLQAQAHAAAEDFPAAEKALRRNLALDPSVNSHLLLAAFLLERTRVEEARSEIEKAVAVAKDTTERLVARVQLANLNVNTGRLDEAESVMLLALKEAPDSSDLVLQLARFYALLGKVDKAETLLVEHAERKPKEVAPLVQLASFYQRVGKMDKALQTTRKALEIDPSSEPVLTQQAEFLMETADKDPGAAERARASLKQVLERNPQSIYGLFTEAKFLLLEGKDQEAADRLRRVIDEQPSSNAHFLLATAYGRLNQLDQARSELIQSLQLDPTNVRARVELVGQYLRTEKYELALQESENGLAQQPGNAPFLLLASEALLRLDRKTEAREKLGELKPEALNTTPLRVRAANLYRTLGDATKAGSLIAEAVRAAPRDIVALRSYVAIEGQDDPVQALEPLNAAIKADPNNAELYALRGDLRMRMRVNNQMAFAAEAERDLKTAIEKDGKLPGPHLRLAQLYREQGKGREALESYERALGLAKGAESVPIRIELAGFQEQQGRPDQARELYEAALKAGDEPIAKNNLAWILANTPNASADELDRAMQLAQDAKESRPDMHAFADTLGFVMLKKGRSAAAISLFKEAISGYEPGAERGRTREHLAMAYEQEGDKVAAVEQLRLASQESPALAAKLGQYYERVGEPEKALSSYREAIERSPMQAIEAYVALADLYRRTNRERQAIDTYESLLAKRGDVLAAKNNLAFLLAESKAPTKKDLDRALTLARDVRQRLSENAEVADTLGWVLVKRKEYAEATKVLEESVSNQAAGPGRSAALYHLAVAQEAQGKKDDARKGLEQALSDSKDFPGREGATALLERLKQ
jgi:tetratricopeptide (TPR) repeat protein